MARNIKEGLDYFPMDIDFFDDPKILMAEDKFGVKGGYIAVRLLGWVYRNGYYLSWDDTTALVFAKRVSNGITHELVRDVVNLLVERGFFDKAIFNSRSVLTSNGIQKRWVDIIQKCKRKAHINPDFLVNSEVRPINTEEIPETSEPMPENPEESTQRKFKKSKSSKVSSEKHLFKDSEFFDFEKFQKEFDNTPYAFCDLEIYHEKLKNWSKSNSNKKVDWIATVRNWMIKDKEENKLKLKKGINEQPGKAKFGEDIDSYAFKRYGAGSS